MARSFGLRLSFCESATGEAKRKKGSMMFPTLRRTRTLTDQVIKEAVDHRQPDWKRVDAGRSSPLSGPRFGVARILVRTGSHALARYAPARMPWPGDCD